MVITEKKEADYIILEVDGRVDTTTAPELQNTILVAFQKMKNIVLDFKKVGYISSAGLRALLLGHKTAISKGGSMKLCHVGASVRDVLDVTGFSDILNIKS